MTAIFHRTAALSIATIGLALASFASPSSAAGTDSPFWGRWKVENPNAPFSARGREYKTIDIAPCGKDFCGVSVKDNGQCGPVLFRFLMVHAKGDEDLRGHGRWGNAKKNVLIWLYDGDDSKHLQNLQLYLGDGYDFGERSGNMPKFEATYKKSGVARCMAR